MPTCPQAPHVHRLRYLLLGAVTCFATSASGQQDDLRPTWECLPEETAVAVRIPDGAAIAEAMKSNTKLGAVLFSEARLDKFRELVLEASLRGEEGEDIAARLENYGFALDDLPQFLAGESGYAILVDQPPDQSPLVVGVGWLQPGEDLAQRALDAVARAIEEREDDEHPPQRVDFELAGHPVMQVAMPVIRVEHGEFELPENYDSLSEAEQNQAWDEAYKTYEQSAVEKVVHRVMLVTSIDGRVLVASAANEVSDADREATSDRLETMLARLLVAHRGEPGGFLPRVTGTRGMEPVFDQRGIPVLEVLGNPARLLKLLRAQPEFQSDPNGEKVMSLLGADQAGPFAVRMVLDGSILHTRAYVSVPAPRSGLLRILNQESLPADVPAWVPATAVSYSHLSFDCGQAYRIIKEEVSRQFPQQADQWFSMVEMQVQNFAQVGLEEVLDSLGSRHVAISYEPEMVRQEVGDGGAGIEVPQDRTAIVSQVTNEDVWNRLLKAIGGFAAFAPALESTDEQGFHGWRLESGGVEGGLVAGKGYLVLAIGRSTLETTLSSLNNPPSGRASLRESDLFARAAELMDLRPSIGLEVTDADRYAKAAHEMVQSMILQMDAYREQNSEEVQEGDLGWLEFAKVLLPGENEMENIFGVAVTELHVDESGLMVRAVNELPPPD